MIQDVQNRPSSPRIAQLITALSFLLLYIPLCSMVVFSFLGSPAGPGAPREWTLEWYRKLASNRQVLDAFNISLTVGLWSTVVSTILGTTAALALTRTRFPGRKIFDALTYVP